MIVLAPASSAPLLAASATLAALPPLASSSPPLSSSPARSHVLQIFASALCPPRSGTRSSSSARFAPALARSRTGRRRGRRGSGGGGGGEDGSQPWGDDDVFSSGSWGGLEPSLGGSGGSGSGRHYGGGGGRGGGGGWDSSNSEFGDWPALAGAAWAWQVVCAASLFHSFWFLLFPDKASRPHGPPFSPQPRIEGLC